MVLCLLKNFISFQIDILPEDRDFLVANVTGYTGKEISSRLPNKNMISADEPNKLSFQIRVIRNCKNISIYKH